MAPRQMKIYGTPPVHTFTSLPLCPFLLLAFVYPQHFHRALCSFNCFVGRCAQIKLAACCWIFFSGMRNVQNSQWLNALLNECGLNSGCFSSLLKVERTAKSTHKVILRRAFKLQILVLCHVLFCDQAIHCILYKMYASQNVLGQGPV